MYINVVTHDKSKITVPFSDGDNLLDLLDDQRMEKLKLRTDCGGLCACVTCHVYIAYPYNESLNPPDPEEQIMLSQVEDKRVESRLACEVVLNKKLDGATITFAPGSALLD